MSDLDNQRAARTEQTRGFGSDDAVGIEAITAAIECPQRVMIADLDVQAGDIVGRNIGRVRNDKIEVTGQRRGIVAGDEMRATRKTAPFCVAARGAQCSEIDIGGSARRIGQLGEQRQQEGTRAGAEIGDPQCTRARAGYVETFERGFDNRLGVGARHQRVRRERELQAPELLDADDAGNRLAGKTPVNLRKTYAGNVVLVVNTASFCGFTPQYKALEALYTRYKPRGLVVLGFPSNDFGDQEPGAAKDIAALCENTFGVRFPMFAKSHVTGPQRDNSLYRELQSRTGQAPRWNFHKYLISRDGRTVSSHLSETDPQGREFVATIEKMLATPYY